MRHESRAWKSQFPDDPLPGGRYDTPSMRPFLRLDPCAYCGGPGGTIDHIEPRALGGANWIENMTGACRKCNSSRGITPMLFFMLGGRAEELARKRAQMHPRKRAPRVTPQPDGWSMQHFFTDAQVARMRAACGTAATGDAARPLIVCPARG